nr:MAG TPA: Lacto-N-biose phosphorylase C-terminal domain [Caudoviricetes sp.]
MIVTFRYNTPNSFVLNSETKNIDYVPNVGTLVKIKNNKYKVSSVIYDLDDNIFNVKLEYIHGLSSNK